MNQFSLWKLQEKFNHNVFTSQRGEFHVNWTNERKTEIGETLSIDYPELEEIGEFDFNSLETGIDILGHTIKLEKVEKYPHFGKTYHLYVIDSESGKTTKRERIFEKEIKRFGEELFYDHEIGQPIATYYLTKRDDKFIIFTKIFTHRDALSKNDNKIEIEDSIAANYLFKKRLYLKLDNYRRDARKFVTLTKDLLVRIQKYIDERKLNTQEIEFLFLDRDAIVFQFIGKQLAERYGLKPSQFRSLQLPNDLEDNIRNNSEYVFDALYNGFPINKEKRASLTLTDIKDMSLVWIDTTDWEPTSEVMSLSDDAYNILYHEIRKNSLSWDPLLSTYQKYLEQQKEFAKHIFLIDGGSIGTSLNIGKALFMQFLPEKEIHTWLVYGDSKSEHYRDFTVKTAHVSSVHNFLERWPKFSKRLLSMKQDRKGKVYQQRGKSFHYDENNNHIDWKVVNLKLGLDKSEPTNAQIFWMALQQEIAHELLGHYDSNVKWDHEYRQRLREKYHEQIYGL